MISIHALLAESDNVDSAGAAVVPYISIHALLAESDLKLFAERFRDTLFLSTLSLRRATITLTVLLIQPIRFLSTLSLRRATNGFAGVLFLIDISIHALLAESDPAEPFKIGENLIFLSTLSLRRATAAGRFLLS